MARKDFSFCFGRLERGKESIERAEGGVCFGGWRKGDFFPREAREGRGGERWKGQRQSPSLGWRKGEGRLIQGGAGKGRPQGSPGFSGDGKRKSRSDLGGRTGSCGAMVGGVLFLMVLGMGKDERHRQAVPLGDAGGKLFCGHGGWRAWLRSGQERPSRLPAVLTGDAFSPGRRAFSPGAGGNPRRRGLGIWRRRRPVWFLGERTAFSAPRSRRSPGNGPGRSIPRGRRRPGRTFPSAASPRG